MADLVLVTGGAGFIGSHLCEGLIERGYSVRVLDTLEYGRREWLPQDIEFIQGDICDRDACFRAVEGVSGGVFHLAAMSRAGPSLSAIDDCTRRNIIGTQNMLMAASEANIKRFIYAGSATYYGNQPAPHSENLKPDFLNFYALSKYVGEEYALLFDRVLDLPVVVLRYFSVYGRRQPKTGAYALVLGIFLDRWRQGRPLEIHGSGAQRRDFIHVNDVVDCTIAAYESDRRGAVYNVGTGKNISVKEIADLISSNQLHVERRPGDADGTLADISRTCRELGWAPKIGFEEGLSELKRSLDSAHAEVLCPVNN